MNTPIEIAESVVITWLQKDCTPGIGGQIHQLGKLASRIADVLATRSMIAAAPPSERKVPTSDRRVPAAKKTKPPAVEGKRPKVSAAGGQCSEPGCDGGAYCEGLCTIHYERQRKAAKAAGTKGKAAPAKVAALDYDASKLGTPEQTAVGGTRKFKCPSYKHCLSYAEAQGWGGFTCLGCNGSNRSQAASGEVAHA